VLDIFKSPVNCKLYADDVKLYTELKTAADESCFQGCLDFLYSSPVAWQLAISSKKCCIATIGKLGDSWGKPNYCWEFLTLGFYCLTVLFTAKM